MNCTEIIDSIKRVASDAAVGVDSGLIFVVKPSVVLVQEGPPAEEPLRQLFAQSSEPIPPFVPGIVLVGVRWTSLCSALTAVTWGEIEVIAAEPLDVRGGEVVAATRMAW